jgi:hypothetical protein
VLRAHPRWCALLLIATVEIVRELDASVDDVSHRAKRLAVLQAGDPLGDLVRSPALLGAGFHHLAEVRSRFRNRDHGALEQAGIVEADLGRPVREDQPAPGAARVAHSTSVPEIVTTDR